jgi:DNA transformation protein
MMMEKVEQLSDLPNIGKDTQNQLNQIGVFSYEDLRKLGAEQAWLKIQEIDKSACIHRLLGLEGAIQGVKKTMLPEERKKALKEFYQWHKIT